MLDRIARLKNLEAFALPLIRRLRELPAAGSWGDWIDALVKLARASLRRPGTVLSVLAELAPMSDVGPVRLDEVLQALSERLRFLRDDPPHRRYGRVFVGSIEEARGRMFDVVFLPGLAEGMFPRKVAEDPLLLDAERARISPALETNRQRREHERLLLRIALAAGERIVFSYPRIDVAQSRPRVPSFYALEIVRAAYGRLPELAEFEANASAAAPARLDHPAPHAFADAIDETEYDLVAREKAAETGDLRYLVENGMLYRSIQTRYKRWEQSKWTSSDGLVDSTVLRSYALFARAYSPTTLQQFAACPYRFALYGIFGLREREAPAPLYQMDPLTRGALFHEVQFRVLRDKSRADRVLDEVAAEYAERLAPAIKRVWDSEIEEIRTDLHGWLQYVSSETEWQPVHAELAFGLKDRERRDPASRSDAVAAFGAIVAGSIDLVERHCTTGNLRVIDHKTGKSPDRRPSAVAGGTCLQPLLYAAAAEQILGAKVERGELFYCTQRGNYTRHSIAFDAASTKWAARALEIINEAILGGNLPAVPAHEACTNCQFRCVCGPYEETRTHRKPPLHALNELRCMP
jgi:ATP-dependent helicase/DNAse subunit B